MNELDRLIFDDLILEFFGRYADSPARGYFLNIFRDAFPTGEVCADLVGFNYIKEIN